MSLPETLCFKKPDISPIGQRGSSTCALIILLTLTSVISNVSSVVDSLPKLSIALIPTVQLPGGRIPFWISVPLVSTVMKVAPSHMKAPCGLYRSSYPIISASSTRFQPNVAELPFCEITRLVTSGGGESISDRFIGVGRPGTVMSVLGS